MLTEDILPSLEALRIKCKEYNEWTRLDGQREQLLHILVAYDYTECGRCVLILTFRGQPSTTPGVSHFGTIVFLTAGAASAHPGGL